MDNPGPDFLLVLAAWVGLLATGIAGLIVGEGVIVRLRRWREYRRGSRA